MNSKSRLVIPILLFYLVVNQSVDAQRYYGGFAGYGRSRLFNYSKKDGYDANYNFGNAAIISAFYEGEYDSTTNFRIQFGYEYQELGLAVINYSATGSTYFDRKVDYRRQLINLDADFVFPFVKRSKYGFNFLLGLTVSYNLNTSAFGTGSQSVYQHIVDSNGNAWSYFAIQSWETDTKFSRDLAQFTVGGNTGIEFSWALSDRMEVLLQNWYCVTVSNIWSKSLPQFRQTSVFNGFITLGLRRGF